MVLWSHPWLCPAQNRSMFLKQHWGKDSQLWDRKSFHCFCPSNAPVREYPQLGIPAIIGYMTTWVCPSGWTTEDCNLLPAGQTAACWAQDGCVQSQHQQRGAASAADWRGLLGRGKRTTAQFDLVLPLNPFHKILLAPCSSNSLSALLAHSSYCH